MGVPFVFGLVLLSVSIINTQSFVILDETEFNIWDEQEDNPNAEAEKLLAALCENYLLSIDSKTIDCQSIRFGIKGVEADDSYHVINKRDADDILNPDEEGSGDNTPEISLYKEPEENESTKEEPETYISDKGENATAIIEPPATPEEQQPLENAPETDNANENEEEAPEVKKEEETVAENVPETSSVNEGEQTEIKESDSAPKDDGVNEEQPPVPEPENKEENASENEDEKAKVLPPDQQSTESDIIPRSETTIAPPAEHSEEPTTTQSPVTSDQQTTQKDVETTTSKPKESEAVNEQQSANAVVLKGPSAPVSVSVEGSDGDKQLAGAAPNAKISGQASEAEQPNTGESTKNVSKAGKDTTILVVLFVVVIVIGAAALTHNILKKRRQKNSENRDVVNGNVKNPSDAEQGTEMKPLMKTSPVIVKEYTDTTKTADA